MILDLISELGPWIWMILGLLLLVGEVLAPGVFMIWFGSAALVIGALTLVPFTDVSWWPWQAQVAAFGVLSLVFVLVGQRLFPSDARDDDAAKINTPLARFVGSEATLVDEIENGVGRVKLGDTTWRVRGADQPAGSRVRVTGEEDGVLIVEPA